MHKTARVFEIRMVMASHSDKKSLGIDSLRAVLHSGGSISGRTKLIRHIAQNGMRKMFLGAFPSWINSFSLLLRIFGIT